MNNEPVAWMQVHYKDNKPTKFSKVQTWEDDVPLYTHPVKELTDKEILCLWDYWSGEIPAIDILDFADKYRRAILNEEGIIEWHQEYCKKMNEETAKKVDSVNTLKECVDKTSNNQHDTYKSQNDSQIDTYRYKELTDEEIQQVLNDFDWFVKFVNPFDFARAILRKAQEK